MAQQGIPIRVTRRGLRQRGALQPGLHNDGLAVVLLVEPNGARRERQAGLLQGAQRVVFAPGALARVAHGELDCVIGAVSSFNRLYSNQVKSMAVASHTWEFEQLARLSRQQPDLVNRAMRRLLDEDAELRWAVVVSAYLEHEINLGRAAELLEMHELELRDRFVKLGIPLRIGPADVAEAQAEADAIRSWFTNAQ